MISLKAFVAAIQEAIMQAHDSLSTSNIAVLDEFFTEEDIDPDDESQGKKLTPKSVTVEYPTAAVDQDGNPQVTEIQVPLITLVPLSITQIESAKISADFDLEVENGELQLVFSKRRGRWWSRGSDTKANRLELTITPIDTSDGLQVLVEGYEAILKRQTSNL